MLGRQGGGGRRRLRGGKRVRVELVGPFGEAMDRLASGDSTGARALMERALMKARAAGDRDGEVAALMNLATTEGSRAEHRRAGAWAEKAIKALGPEGDPRLRAIAWFQRGVASLQSGAAADSVVSFKECAKLATQLGDRAMEGHVLALEGRARQKVGDGQGAVDRYLRAVPLLGREGGPGSEMIEWMKELKAAMGPEKFYEAMAEGDRKLGSPLLRSVIEEGGNDAARALGVGVADLRAALERK